MRSKIATVALLLGAAPCVAQNITVQFTNNQPAGGFATSPLWFGMHNGSFDFFNGGAAASSATELLAELGDGSGLTAALGAAGVASTLATAMPVPQFTPGESAMTVFNVPNRAVNRWFSFASMVVPSNDFFIGNDNATAYEIFDAAGVFRGPLTIQIFGSNGWDAGTEVNNINNGIAFLVGRDPLAGAAEGATIRPIFSVAGNPAYLAAIIGQQTPAYTMSDGLTAGELLGTITITPAPGSAIGLAIAGGVLGMRRRRA